jgi:serine phosphatase RsbU (regulator of sigma subunit)
MSLRQSENVNEAKDGMDIALCRIDKTTNELVFAGANNSMHLLRNNKLIELKGDKQPIGISHFNITQQFIQQSISLIKNDLIYLFTDGYPDQFGGEAGKKFKYKQLEQLLLDIHQKDMEVQREILEKVHIDWKGNLSQVDDICIVGIKI